MFAEVLTILIFFLAIVFIAVAAAIVVLTVGRIRIWIKEERKMKLNENK